MHINHHVSRVFQTASVFIDRQAFLIWHWFCACLLVFVLILCVKEITVLQAKSGWPVSTTSLLWSLMLPGLST